MPGKQTQLELQEDHAAQHPGADDGTVRILRSAAEVEAVREFWASSPGTRDSDIDIFLGELRRNSEDLKPRVFVLYRGGAPVVLLAGKIVRREFTCRVGYFRLFKPMVNVVTIPYGGLRGEASPEDCRKFVQEIIKCLKNGEADIAHLQYVDADSALFRCAKTEPKFLFRDHVTPLRPHRKKKLPGSVQQLYAESSHGGKQLRRVAKKLSNEFPGQIKVDRFEALADLDRTLSVVEEIAKKTWQRKVSTIGFNIKDAPLIEAFKAQAEGGHLRIYTLYLGGKPCAFWIGAVYQRTFISDFLGYDPDFSSYSPGTYLLSRIMEDFCSEGIEEIDFGFSDEEYKRRFSNVSWQDTHVHLFAPSPRGLALSAMRMITVLPHEAVRVLLKQSNLYTNAKVAWRKMAMVITPFQAK